MRIYIQQHLKESEVRMLLCVVQKINSYRYW